MKRHPNLGLCQQYMNHPVSTYGAAVFFISGWGHLGMMESTTRGDQALTVAFKTRLGYLGGYQHMLR